MKTTWLEASAGTGKTTFLISQTHQAKAEETMFITFSNAAANELRVRIKKDDVYITTLHALAFKIILSKFENKEIAQSSLRNQAILQLLENDEFLQLINWLLNERIAIDETITHTNKPELASDSYSDNLALTQTLASNALINTNELEHIENMFFTKLGDLRKKQPFAEPYNTWALNRFIAHKEYKNAYAAWVQGSVNGLIQQTEEELKSERNLLYYDDLITLAMNMIKEDSGDLVYKFFGNIKLLLIDEAQDLSTNQWELVRTILDEWSMLDGQLIVASDKKQLIYDFQGATIEGFESAKEYIKKLSQNWEIKQLNHTYRLPKVVCDFINLVGPKMGIDYVEHSTQRDLEGSVEFMQIDDIAQIAERIKLQNIKPMVLFKYRTPRMEELAHAFFAKGLLINSPFSVQHPVIKDFQYLLDWVYNGSNLAKAIVNQKTQKTFQMHGVSQLAFEWLMAADEFYTKHLQSAKGFWQNALMKYALFYENDPLSAISDAHNFYKNHQENEPNIFNSGIYFNTIHSSKGMEAREVFLLDTDFTTRMSSCDTMRLLYVGLTRTKGSLIIPVFKENVGKDGTWENFLASSS